MLVPMTEPMSNSKRRKAMTDEGRLLLQRQRARIAREQAELGEKWANEAKHAAAAGAVLAAKNDPVHNAISRGIVRRVAGVLASEKVTPGIEVRPVDLDEGETMRAYTDFRTITVNYTPHSDKRLLAATMRGLMYHEGGHIRWSTPYDTLVQMVVDAESLRAAVAGERPRPIYVPGHDVMQHQRVWNALEDQRMETAVVSDSPRKAAYFTPLVMTEIIQTPERAAANYPLLVWRRYLPRNIRRGARAAFVALVDAKGNDGEALAKAFEAATTKYVLATDHLTMWEAVCEAVALYAEQPPQASLGDQAMGHQSQKNSPAEQAKAKAGEKLEIPVDPSMIDEDDEGDEAEDDDTIEDDDHAEDFDNDDTYPSVDDDEADDDSDDEAEGQGAAQAEGDDTEGDDEGDADSGDDIGESTEDEAEDDSDEVGEGAGGDAGNHEGDDEPLTQDEIDQAKAEADDKWLNDAAVEEDLKAYEDALNTGASQLPVYIGGVSNDLAAASKAEILANQIEQAFQAATMDREPAWIEQQRRGIINVNRYATRQAGDVEYFRNWVEDDQPGYNLAVSVLLDYSGSMGSHMVELAQCGYAVKLACSNLGIPCTVTLWDSKAATLWDANEEPRGLPIIRSAGSTNPSQALADLENQRYERENHLVLVMTDGIWDDEWNQRKNRGRPVPSNRTVAFYAGQGRTFIGFGYDTSTYAAQQYAKNLNGYGIRESYGITDLMAIPKRLQEALIRLA